MVPALPRLPFGNATAVENDDLDTFTATQRAVMPSIRRYEPLQGRGPFRHRSASISLGDVRLAATASSRSCSPPMRSPRRFKRLVTARDRLERATAGDTVATVALACGFTRLATFSAAYLRRFGESPSATLARGRNRGRSPSA